MADLKGFSTRLIEIGVSVAEGGDRVVRKAALACDQAVVIATPVDTGRARSNWLASVDAPRTDVVEPAVPGKKGSTGESNTQASMAAAAGVIAGYAGGSNREIHIANNLPYIEELNRGSSRQAPANYVQDGVAAAVGAIQGARVLSSDD